MTAALESGAKVGSYVIEGLVGRGGTAEVYRARDAGGRPVALKVLRADLVEHPEVVARFLREAKAAEIVRHPNVVEVYDVGKDDSGCPYIVQELLEGEDLSQFVMRLGGKLSLEHVLLIMLPVVDAAAFAHRRGVVHRDLKPENVFLAKRGDEIVPKLLDFGISRFSTANEVRITVAGQAVGTPAYMSPEQVQNAQDVDTRSDVWALGTIMFELLSGRLPYTNTDARSLLVEIVTREPPKLRSVSGDVPAGVARVVDRGLKHDRSERYRSAVELGRDLRLAITQETNLIDKYPHLREQIGEIADSPLTSGVHMAVTPAENPSSSKIELDVSGARRPMHSSRNIELADAGGAIGQISRNTTDMIAATGVTSFQPAAVGTFTAADRKSLPNLRPTGTTPNSVRALPGGTGSVGNLRASTGGGTVPGGVRTPDTNQTGRRQNMGARPVDAAEMGMQASPMSTRMASRAAISTRPPLAEQEETSPVVGMVLHSLIVTVTGVFFYTYRHVDQMDGVRVLSRAPAALAGYGVLAAMGACGLLVARKQKSLRLPISIIAGGVAAQGFLSLMLALALAGAAGGIAVSIVSALAPLALAVGGAMLGWNMWRRPKGWVRAMSVVVMTLATMCLVIGVEHLIFGH